MSDEKKHIINLGEASGLSDNDYLMIDSASQGTRKFKARGIVSGTFIDDTQESLNTTYSSSKIEDLLDDKTDIDDTQASVTSTYSSSKIEDLISNAPNAVELSYASYQALTEAEKTDGTIYMVYDDPTDNYVANNGFCLNYSTDEQLTGGKWVDGKPIYQRTYVFTSDDLQVATISNSLINGRLLLDSSDWDMCWIDDSASMWFVTNPTGNGTLSTPINYPAGGNAYLRNSIHHTDDYQNNAPYIYADCTYSAQYFYTNISKLKMIYTIRYTKTTD